MSCHQKTSSNSRHSATWKPHDRDAPPAPRERTELNLAGALYALAAYVAWGLGPIYWKAIDDVPPAVVLGHRVLWSALLLAAILVARKRVGDLRRVLRPRFLWPFALSGALVAANWFFFIFAVQRGFVLQASLGYFINPLLNVVLGLLFFGERLRRGQWLAVFLAAGGVLQLGLEVDRFPWLALALAFSFGLYGVVRKTAPVDALLGSSLETGLLVIPALLLLAAQPESFSGFREASTSTRTLLVLAGAQTALPLLWFANAARRLPLSTLGFFQYIAPTGQFLLAIFVYKEPFAIIELRAFACIWLAMLLFSLEAHHFYRARRRQSLEHQQSSSTG